MKQATFSTLLVFLGMTVVASDTSYGQTEKPLTVGQVKDVDAAVTYFEGGGAFSFRFASSPPAAAQDSTAGSIILLRPTRSTETRYTLGRFQFDTPPKDPRLVATVAAVLQDSDMRRAFAERFAKAIDSGQLQAYYLNRSPTLDKDPFSLDDAKSLRAPQLVTFFHLSIKK